jgi:hypothetical protein
MRKTCQLMGTLAASVLLTLSTQGARFETFLDGPSEIPPNASPGTGFATLDWDEVAQTFTIDVSFSGLIGNTTVAHIHGPTAVPFDLTAGVATTTPTFPGFPAGVTAGTYNATFDLTDPATYNGSFLAGAGGGTPAGAAAALFNAIVEGRAYLNLHSTFAPGGEIRGFWRPVPDQSATAPLLIGACFLLAGAARRLKMVRA